MNEKLKTICLILITITIVVGTGFYCWETYKKQNFYSQKQKCIEKCYSVNKNIIQDSSDRLEACEELCKYNFISSAILSELDYFKLKENLKK